MKLKSIIFFIMVFGFFAMYRNAIEQTGWLIEGNTVPFCISQQKVSIILPKKSDINSPPGIVISSPPVKAMLPGIGDTKETKINIVISNPVLEIMLPGIEKTGNNKLNEVISKPKVDIFLPGIGNINNIQFNKLITGSTIIVEFK